MTSPSTGWPLKAVPVAVQSERSPFSKSKLSTRPSADFAGKPASVELAGGGESTLGCCFVAGGVAFESASAARLATLSCDIFGIVHENKRALFVADDDIGPTYRR